MIDQDYSTAAPNLVESISLKIGTSPWFRMLPASGTGSSLQTERPITTASFSFSARLQGWYGLGLSQPAIIIARSHTGC